MFFNSQDETEEVGLSLKKWKQSAIFCNHGHFSLAFHVNGATLPEFNSYYPIWLEAEKVFLTS